MRNSLDHSEYRPDIDGLRAIAVAIVVAYHAFPGRFPGGFVGVDVFFVISGYLITSIIFQQLDRGEFTILAFYARRIRRIFPSLIVMTLVTFAIGWFVLSVKEFKSLGSSMAASAAFIQNLWLLREVGYFDVAAARKPLLHLWSLGIEEQYYIIWPVILIVVSRVKLNPISTVIGLAAASFWFGMICINTDVDSAFYLPFSRFWELLLGSGLAMAIAHLKNTPLIERVSMTSQKLLQQLIYSSEAPHQPNLLVQVGSLFGLALIGYATFRFNSQIQYPGRHALIPVLAAILLILSKRSWVNQKVLASQPMGFLGLISYPLYLWHFPLIAYAHILSPDGVTRTIMSVVVLLSGLLAWLSYRFIESPIRLGRTKRWVIPLLVIGMSAICTIGVVIYRTDGLPSRIPIALRGFMLTGDETSAHWRRGKCLLLPDQGSSAFTDDCAGNGGHPLLFLWGDSYAAAQYPGLLSLRASGGYDVAEFTSSACPPIIGFVHNERPFCKGNNDYVLERIKALRPEIVILHSTWQYDPNAMGSGLADTVARLRALAVKKIVLLGPVPTWKGSGLSGNVIDYYYEQGLQLMPARTKYRLVEDGLEDQMSSFAKNLGIEYISVRSVMCNQDGCLARIGQDDSELTAFDSGHMTVAGSTYLERAILPMLLRGVK